MDLTVPNGTTVQVDIAIKSGIGPLNVLLSDKSIGTHVYINEYISASKSWMLNINPGGAHQLVLDNLDPNHQIVYIAVKVQEL